MQYSSLILLLLLGLFFTPLQVQSQKSTTPYVEYHKNGNIHKKGMINGNLQLTGNYIINYPSGNISSKMVYQEGKLHGVYTSYYENGNILWQGELLKGHKNGIWKNYSSNKKLKIESTYINDTVNGIYKSYFENGKIKSEGKCFKGLKHGLWKYGKIKHISAAYVNYKNGLADGEVIIFLKNKKYAMFTIKKGRLKGKFGLFGDDINKLQFIGEADEYDVMFNGYLKSEGNYDDISNKRNESLYRTLTKGIKELFLIIPKS